MSDTPASVRVVVIGGGPAAHRFVASYLAIAPTDARVTVLTQEPRRPYDRLALPATITTETDLTLDPDIWDDARVDLRVGDRALGIDRRKRTVASASGEHRYEYCVLATGSRAATLKVPGADRALGLRTVDDVAAIRTEVERQKGRLGRPPVALVVGGGVWGLEVASGLRGLGARSGIVQARPWLMAEQLGEAPGRVLNAVVGAAGISLHLGRRPVGIALDAGNEVTGVQFRDRASVPADLVVAAVGTRPRDGLAAEAGLAVADDGGVLVDASCRTSDPHIYAIGEVASHGGRTGGLGAAADAMAEVAAARLSGRAACYAGHLASVALRLPGIEVATFGDAASRTPGALDVMYSDPARGMFQKIVLASDCRTLLGGVFVGDASPFDALLPLVGQPLEEPASTFLSFVEESVAPAVPLRPVGAAPGARRPSHVPHRKAIGV